MTDRQDPRPDPVDHPTAPPDHVRGENVYPGATAEPTMGWTVSPESRVHHTDETGGPARPHPAIWAALLIAVLAVVVLLVMLVV